jgi:RNA polymerase sigma-70 factor (ECF subfamily)
MTGLDFAALFDTYYPRLYGYIRSRVANQQMAEDFTASAFERAFSRSHSFDTEKGSFSTWLFSIGRNLLLDYYRANQRQPTHYNLDEFSDLAAATASPETVVLRREQQRQLVELLTILSERDQEIIQLRFYGRLTNRAIADLLDINEKTVSVIILRALRKLKAQFERQEEM